mgnify:CR=1 FL=1
MARRDRLDTQDLPKVKVSGESFLTPPGPLSDLVIKSVKEEYT